MARPLDVPFEYQSETYNCGPHNMRLVMLFHGVDVDELALRMYGKTSVEEGTTCEMMTTAARLAEFYAYGTFDGSLELLKSFIDRGQPVIVYTFDTHRPEFGWGDFDRAHYLIVTGVFDNYVTVHDSDEKGGSHLQLSKEEFMRIWSADEGRRDKKWMLVVAKEPLDSRFTR